jgi:hypothetical protein
MDVSVELHAMVTITKEILFSYINLFNLHITGHVTRSGKIISAVKHKSVDGVHFRFSYLTFRRGEYLQMFWKNSYRPSIKWQMWDQISIRNYK